MQPHTHHLYKYFIIIFSCGQTPPMSLDLSFLICQTFSSYLKLFVIFKHTVIIFIVLNFELRKQVCTFSSEFYDF